MYCLISKCSEKLDLKIGLNTINALDPDRENARIGVPAKTQFIKHGSHDKISLRNSRLICVDDPLTVFQNDTLSPKRIIRDYQTIWEQPEDERSRTNLVGVEQRQITLGLEWG